MKEHLLHYFPFLKKEFRKLSDNELQSEEVFKELFPDDEVIDFSKLKAIAVFQKPSEMTFVVDTKAVKTMQTLNRKKISDNEV